MSRTSRDKTKRELFVHSGEEVDNNGKYLGYGSLIYCGKSSRNRGKQKREGSRKARRILKERIKKDMRSMIEPAKKEISKKGIDNNS